MQKNYINEEDYHMRSNKRWLSLLLVAAMMISALPISAMASDESMTASSIILLQSPMSDSGISAGTITLTAEENAEAYPVSALIARINGYVSNYDSIADNETIVAWSVDNDAYTLVDGDSIDLTDVDYNLYLIVGTKADQLDPNNRVYHMYVEKFEPNYRAFSATAYNETKGADIKVYQTNSHTQQYYYEYINKKSVRVEKEHLEIDIDVKDTDYDYSDAVSVKLTKNSGNSYSSGYLDQYDVSIYAGEFATASAAEEAAAEDETLNITESIFGDGCTVDLRDYDGNLRVWYTLVIKDGDTPIYAMPLLFNMYAESAGINTYSIFYKDDGGNLKYLSSDSGRWQTKNNEETITKTLYREDSVANNYYLHIEYRDPEYYYSDGTEGYTVEKAVAGRVSKSGNTIPGTDIKDKLCSDNYYGSENNLYYAAFTNGKAEFTFLDTAGNVYYVTIIIEVGTTPKPEQNNYDDSKDAYFYITGVDLPSGYVNEYIMEGKNDSLYEDGYQTILMLKSGDAVTAEKIKPSFWTAKGATVTANYGDGNETVESGDELSDWTDDSLKAVNYQVAAAGENNTRNYYVSFLTKQDGAKLFVNGVTNNVYQTVTIPGEGGAEDTVLPLRTVYLDEAHGYHHDIFIANIGDAELTLDDPELTFDANTPALTWDGYWKLGDTKTLPAFTETYSPDNVAKLRLVLANPDEAGRVSGTLTIKSAAGNQTVKLSGLAGEPMIVTEQEELANKGDLVRYVPYGTSIMTNLIGDTSGKLSFSMTGLPKGVSYSSETGRIYGVPTENGTFDVLVTAKFIVNDKTYEAEKEYVLTVAENSDENLDAMNKGEYGYEFKTGENDEQISVASTMSSYTQQVMESVGEYAEFQDLWIDGVKKNGVKLGEGEEIPETWPSGVDYYSEEGSTKITIRAQTFQAVGRGKHTIAAEFQQGDKVVSTSQNYTSTVSSGSSSSSSSKSSTNTNQSNDLGYTVNNGVATVVALEDAKLSELENQAKDGELVLDMTKSGKEANAAVIPAETVKKLANTLTKDNAKAKSVLLKLTDAQISMDKESLASLAAQATSGNVSIALKETPVSALTNEQQAASEKLGVAKVVSAEVKNNGTQISNFGGGRVTMSVPFTVPEGRNARDYAVYFLKNDGSKSLHAATYQVGMMSFRVAHFSEFAIANEPREDDFADVADNMWYTSLIDYVARMGMMNGVGGGRFAPDMTLDRAMFAQILYNLEKPETSAQAMFEDVSGTEWYANAVNWAAQAGVVDGVGNGKFEPTRAVTRGELVTMLYKYAQYKQYSVSDSEELSAFPDNASLPSWAKSAMEWAVGTKLISGIEGSLSADTTATRSQAAKVLTYFMEMYEA